VAGLIAEQLKKKLPDAAGELNIILEATRQANESLNELRRIDEGIPIKEKVVPFSLEELVEQTLALFRPAVANGLKLCSQINKGFTLEGTPGKISSLLLNLLINARDAINETGGTGEITVTLTKREIGPDQEIRGENAAALKPGPYAELAVSDNGCGIKAEDRPRIFEPGFSTKGQVSNYGQGLADILKTVTDFGGDIIVDSQAGKGTTFRLLFPLK
jgi:signal transduction histidine kinase